MSETRSAETRHERWLSVGVTAVLTVSAAVTIGYWSVKALGEEDTEAMESPLMLSVARQLVVGPWELYGPFGGSNPLVLIHAPLYYRAAALLAWPMARAGLQPVDAARAAGRLISALGLLATVFAAYRLGRLGGLPRWAGWWSALLVAASPMLSGQPFAVRPDMAGVALQSWGVVLVLESLVGSRRRLGLGSTMFGLSACVKQHLLGGWAVSGVLLALGWLRGRLGLGAAVRVLLPGVAVSAFVYGAEWLVTGGRIWDAAFLAAANVGRVHPGSWDHVLILFLGIVNRSSGLLAILAAAALIAAGARPGMLRRLLTGAGIIAIGLILAALVVEVAAERPSTGFSVVLVTVVAAVVALPAIALVERTSFAAIGFDLALCTYLVAELGLVAILARISTGAWLNYGIPATVFAAALAARALSRALDSSTSWRAAPLAAVASLAMLASSIYGPRETEQRHDIERAMVESIYGHLERPRSSYFFTTRPGSNRVNGRLELVYDDWLYPVFESIGLAQRRWHWLGPALARGPVRVVVNTTDRPSIDRTALDLRRLGYRHDVNVGPFFVWIR